MDVNQQIALLNSMFNTMKQSIRPRVQFHHDLCQGFDIHIEAERNCFNTTQVEVVAQHQKWPIL
jgi:hypothetical protein